MILSTKEEPNFQS